MLSKEIVHKDAASVIFIGIVLAFTVICGLLMDYRRLQEENRLLMLREKMLEEKLGEIENVMEENYTLSHDFKNHILVLRTYAYEENITEINRYLDELVLLYFKTRVNVWTKNKVLDLILHQKCKAAQLKGIRFAIYAVPIAERYFSSSDLCTLFGNLLDNATEACEKIRSSDKWIEVKIQKQGNMLFIEIANSIEAIPKEEKGQLLTVKKDKKRHGYGLKNIKRVVEKYEGNLQYCICSNVFRVNITFFDMGKN